LDKINIKHAKSDRQTSIYPQLSNSSIDCEYELSDDNNLFLIQIQEYSKDFNPYYVLDDVIWKQKSFNIVTKNNYSFIKPWQKTHELARGMNDIIIEARGF
jgi:hypothetical protein